MRYEIAVVDGDGIGEEVCQSALSVVKATPGLSGVFDFRSYVAGAEEYRRSGSAYPEASFEGCRKAHAILHGATGIPGVTYPDGTETGIEFGLQTRFRLDLYANVRPIKLRAGVDSRLRDRKPGDIDYVIVRENTEGMYAARGSGSILRDEIAVDNLVVTRKGIERISRFAFELARKRNGAPGDGKRRVTLCDKANVLRSYAFFRKVFNEVAEHYPDIETDYAYADAMTCHLVERPEFYDVIVTENMFGDIISDLAAVTVGSMGMSPSSELGDHNGFFQAAHGSAPTIAGQNIANPYGTILSASSMLVWLGERHGDPRLIRGGAAIERAVDAAMASPGGLTRDLGGSATTSDVTRRVIDNLASQTSVAAE
ncbi:MAG: isocitrate/isopropylmalate dehydrogenase family protein [Bosea sp.]|uniref:isocitrate/isopropylmalate dehydrogenase family protein n=1 Tax=Bosea sp. (in: a-proteobacteria) TaxID=1871050 RepID=UPI001AD0620E|nr:isocitrate/isopropylmalate dehydrogenase family protein [Bosea sp. (in: a-proteobacteria)]MBN9472067.1 isocitrate/isopropylmalate dehydrogenase family protein [Bosea sp. (in: a-proteobacteria)]